MRARMGRHFRKSKAIRWHIDHLTQQAGMLQAALIEGGAECNIVRVLVATGEFRIPLKGFGSTDCRRCRSHLLHLRAGGARSEEHTSELQSLMRNPYAVFCLKKKT